MARTTGPSACLRRGREVRCAVAPTCHGLEYVDPILAEPLEVKEGHAVIPNRPGHGVAWDEGRRVSPRGPMSRQYNGGPMLGTQSHRG